MNVSCCSAVRVLPVEFILQVLHRNLLPPVTTASCCCNRGNSLSALLMVFTSSSESAAGPMIILPLNNLYCRAALTLLLQYTILPCGSWVCFHPSLGDWGGRIRIGPTRSECGDGVGVALKAARKQMVHSGRSFGTLLYLCGPVLLPSPDISAIFCGLARRLWCCCGLADR